MSQEPSFSMVNDSENIPANILNESYMSNVSEVQRQEEQKSLDMKQDLEEE